MQLNWLAIRLRLSACWSPPTASAGREVEPVPTLWLGNRVLRVWPRGSIAQTKHECRPGAHTGHASGEYPWKWTRLPAGWRGTGVLRYGRGFDPRPQDPGSISGDAGRTGSDCPRDAIGDPQQRFLGAEGVLHQWRLGTPDARDYEVVLAVVVSTLQHQVRNRIEL